MRGLELGKDEQRLGQQCKKKKKRKMRRGNEW